MIIRLNYCFQENETGYAPNAFGAESRHPAVTLSPAASLPAAAPGPEITESLDESYSVTRLAGRNCLKAIIRPAAAAVGGHWAGDSELWSSPGAAVAATGPAATE